MLGIDAVEIRLSEEGGRPCAVVDAVYGPLRVTVSPSSSPLPALARAMLDQGYRPCTVATVTRNGKPAFRPATLEAWAKLAVSEGDARSARLVKWRPFDGVKT